MIFVCPQCRRDWPLAGRREGEPLVCSCGYPGLVPEPRPFHAEVWHCGSCGAGLSAGSRECAYCGTGLKPLDGKAFCARCLAYLQADARFCSHCGAHALEAGAMPQATNQACPRCGDSEKLMGVPLGLHHGEACPRCQGLWLSQATFQRFVRDFTAPENQKPEGSGLAGEAAKRKAGSGGHSATVVYLPCPVCRTRMARQNYMRVSGIILDTCPGHGLWLDSEELRGIADFLRSGGVIKAQRVEAEAVKTEARRAKASSWPAGVNDAPSTQVSRLFKDLLGEALGL